LKSSVSEARKVNLIQAKGSWEMWPPQNKKPKQSTEDRNAGFTLIELLVVMAIILIIAAIAIPNLLRARMAANESSAVGSLRTLNTAQAMYLSTYQVGYAPSFVALGPVAAGATPACGAAGLVDAVLGAASPTQKSGYSFVYGPGTIKATLPAGSTCTAGWGDGYTVQATPLSVGTTGQRTFCTDSSGVIYGDSTGAAIAVTAPACAPTAGQPPLQ
jgi:type IV pilus assembly protein PilA